MRRRSVAWLVGAGVLGILLALLGAHMLAAAGPEGPRAPIPRVCWFSDYDNKRLSNQCTYDESGQRWLMPVDGRLVPAEGVPLPEANLCHYFSGPTCPERRGSR
ncbi:MAG: hypothetical protein AB7V23_14765 [Candidatus Nanopelagicales bacterium]